MGSGAEGRAGSRDSLKTGIAVDGAGPGVSPGFLRTRDPDGTASAASAAFGSRRGQLLTEDTTRRPVRIQAESRRLGFSKKSCGSL